MNRREQSEDHDRQEDRQQKRLQYPEHQVENDCERSEKKNVGECRARKHSPLQFGPLCRQRRLRQVNRKHAAFTRKIAYSSIRNAMKVRYGSLLKFTSAP